MFIHPELPHSGPLTDFSSATGCLYKTFSHTKEATARITDLLASETHSILRNLRNQPPQHSRHGVPNDFLNAPRDSKAWNNIGGEILCSDLVLDGRRLERFLTLH
jgi:hypothetical protein